jgi:hypothetical protein
MKPIPLFGSMNLCHIMGRYNCYEVSSNLERSFAQRAHDDYVWSIVMALDSFETGVIAGPEENQDSTSTRDDILLEFRSERKNESTEGEDPRPSRSTSSPSNVDDDEVVSGRPFSAARIPPLWALSFGACVLIGLATYLLSNRNTEAKSASAAAATGTANITSRPDGLMVVVDEEVRGTTPLKLTLPLGLHSLKVQAGSEERSLPLIIEASTTVSQYIDMSSAVTPQGVGHLEVTSEPAGSRVRIDGTIAGVTPLTLATIAVGSHLVEVGTGEGTVRRNVTIVPGATASIFASMVPPSAGGWVSFEVPFEMQVIEAGRLVGTTSMDRVMLPAGSHQLDLVNAALEFRTTIRVQVVAGAATAAVVPIQNGTLSVNAHPWAEVEVEGRSIGTTPLANITLPIGRHEIVFKHPQFGERRKTVVIAVGAPARVAVDFTE